jgi:glycogen operon protein
VELWSSADEAPSTEQRRHSPGDVLPIPGTSMRLFRVD